MTLFDPNSLGTVSRLVETSDGLVSVYVGRKRVGRVPKGKVQPLGIMVGVEWTAELGERAALAVEVLRAKKKAVALLKVRGRSRGELRERLAGAGFAARAVEGAIEELVAARLLNDAALAEDGAAKALAKGMSAAATRAGLRSRGVTEEDAGRAVAQAGASTELARATEAARNRLAKLPESLDAAAKWRRLLSALGRLGYEEETAREAVGRVLGFQDE